MNGKTTAMAVGYGISQCPTPLPWKDLSAEDRIERLRGVIKDQQIRISRLESMMYQLEKELIKHRHSLDGVPVRPVEENDIERPPDAPPSLKRWDMDGPNDDAFI